MPDGEPKTQELFVFADPAINAAILESDTSLAELLAREGSQIAAGSAANPGAKPGSRLKEPVSILIGTAAVIVALTPVISRVLSAFTRRPVIVTELVCVPIEDSQGNVVQDSAGQPVCTWVERSRLLESRDKAQEKNKLDIRGPLGVRISYASTRSEG